MHRRQFLRLLSGKAAVALGFGLAGCTDYGDYPSRRVSPHPDSYYEYYYYPDVNVYFHIHTGFYYYHHGGVWHRSRRLPSHFRLKRHHRRRLYIRGPRPHDRNREHRREYDRRGDRRGARRDDPQREGRREGRREERREGRREERREERETIEGVRRRRRRWLEQD